MKCLKTLLLVAGVALLTACGGAYTYTSYEVIRQADRLHTGDEVHVVPLTGDAYLGQVVSVRDGRLTIQLEGDRKRTVEWADIRVIERVRRVKAR